MRESIEVREALRNQLKKTNKINDSLSVNG